MKRLAIAFLVLGMGLAVWLIVENGAPMIGSALRAAGWTGLLAISCFHLMGTALMGLAWWRLQRIGKIWVFIWGRLVRDAGSEVLPLSQIGGYVLGARAVIVHGVPGVGVAASTAVDATLEFGSQIAYATLGLILFTILSPGSRVAPFFLLVICISAVAAAAFISLQKRGSDLLARLAERVADSRLHRIFGGAAAVQAEIKTLFRLRRVWPSYLLHLGAWLLSGVEAWLALRLMGTSLSLPAVLAIESLVYATRAMAFMMPNAFGIQEGAYLILGGAAGLTPEFALGLSLLKRGRDLAIGIPALVTWQLWENRKRWTAPAGVPVPAPATLQSKPKKDAG